MSNNDALSVSALLNAETLSRQVRMSRIFGVLDMWTETTRDSLNLNYNVKLYPYIFVQLKPYW